MLPSAHILRPGPLALDPLVEIAAGGPFYFAPLEVNSSASSPAP